jgi:hypothetical protein
LPTFEETLAEELLHAGKLDCKHRGEIAELAFMRKAATLGFAVAKPWGDSDRYDVVLSIGNAFSRIQIKSVWYKPPARGHYRVKTTGSAQKLYTATDIDFLVAYIFPKNAWYVFPVTLIEGRTSCCLSPGSKRSIFERYREAWDLMRPAEAGLAAEEVAAKAAAGP